MLPLSRRQFLTQGLALTLLPVISQAASAAIQAGKDYQVLGPTPLPGPNVEVLEVFSYGCPHCAHLAPYIEPWSHKLPASVVFRRIPVTFGHEQWAVLARTYYVLDTLHQADRLQVKIFQAIHDQNINLFSEDVLFDWLEQQGVKRDQFIPLYRSFSIQSKVQQGDQTAMNYGVDGVPTVIIDGRYATSPTQAGSIEALFPVMNTLIAEEMQLKKKR